MEAPSAEPIVLEHSSWALSFSSDGRCLAASSSGQPTGEAARVRVWDLGTRQSPITFAAPGVCQMAFVPRQHVVATSGGNEVRLWDAATGELQRTLLAAPDGGAVDYSTLAFSPDGERLAVAESVPPVQPAAARRGPLQRMLTALAGRPEVRDTVPRGTSRLRVVRVSDGEPIAALDGGDCDLRFLPDGRGLLAIYAPVDDIAAVDLWDVETGTRLAALNHEDILTLYGQDRAVLRYAASRDGRRLAITGDAVHLWEQADSEGGQGWKATHRLSAQEQGIWIVLFSPDGESVVTMGAEALDADACPTGFTLRAWSAGSGAPLWRVPVRGKCYCFALSPDGSTVAAMSAEVDDYFSDKAPEYLLTLWDRAGRELEVRRTPSRRTNLLYHHPQRMLFSPDGAWLAVDHVRHVELWRVGDPGTRPG